jgi:hypothetical protein
MAQLAGLSMEENKNLENFVRLIARHLELTEELVLMFERVDSVMSSDEGKTAVTNLFPIWRAQVDERMIHPNSPFDRP